MQIGCSVPTSGPLTGVDTLTRIATEAEMNKVSWTSRDDLYRATSVVLTTVLLMAVYLFGVDWVWSNLLQLIGVLRFGNVSPANEQK